MLLLCPVHQKAQTICVSRKVRDILVNHLPFSDYTFFRVVVHTQHNGQEINKGYTYLEKEDVLLLELPLEPEIHLLGRDYGLREWNDRKKLFEIRPLVKKVCEDCFAPLAELKLW
ncbi:hypothetical protein KXR87_23020 [Yokenella regensburgei]|uniref:hypothetical protein n=1 Tax=Yokenella regensburgei TaxID=158877 RepID=UPI003F17BD9C